MKERTKLIWIILIFLASYYIPWNHAVIRQSGLEAFMMLQEYARKHVLTCLIPAFFIAGYGVFGTPAVIIDGNVKSVGKIPTREEIKGWITDNCL